MATEVLDWLTFTEAEWLGFTEAEWLCFLEGMPPAATGWELPINSRTWELSSDNTC